MVNHVAAAAIDSMVPFHLTHVAWGTGGVSGTICEPFASPGLGVTRSIVWGGVDQAASYHAAGNGLGDAASYVVGSGGIAPPYPFRAALAAALATAIAHGGTSAVFYGGA
eukprot:13606950-Ditylum_brightwellii.AAC.1